MSAEPQCPGAAREHTQNLKPETKERSAFNARENDDWMSGHIAAQAAGTTYLLVHFGQTDYVADTIEGYHNALKGRETEKYTEKLAARLKRLESR